MRRDSLVRGFAKKNNLSIVQSESVVNAVIDYLIEKIENEKELTILGLGRFYHLKRKESRCRYKGVLMEIDPCTILKFKPCPEVKAIVREKNDSFTDPDEEDEEE